MYGNHCFTDKISATKQNDEYDVCNTEVGQKFVVQWSPQNRPCYLSRNRYASPRPLSKSVPRRNRTLVRYNINRSLNFEIGGTSARSNSYKSQNSSSDSSLSTDNDCYLSRSAKILRALNIDYSPLKSMGSATRKINKSLNFDSSPSPQKLMSIGKSKQNKSTLNSVSPLPKINKTLNFDTSSEDSSVNSRMDSSVESIDENQNQTPSQRNKKAKKSLDYRSPDFTSINLVSPILSAPLPTLRSELRNRINCIIQSTTTPNLQSLKRNLMKNRLDEFGASTPRNLFHDFHDDEDEDAAVRSNDRPQTPENYIKIVPESMSAIKRSHKKERVLGRREKCMAYQSETCSGSEFSMDTEVDLVREENGPKTPSSTQYESPNQCGRINSIKQSHKKNKSKGRSFVDNSDDEMSETGSIFNYTNEEDAVEKVSSINNENCPIEGTSSAEKEGSTGNEMVMLPGEIRDAEPVEMVQEARTDMGNSSIEQSSDYEGLTTPLKKAQTPPLRPGTPENRINFLQRIMTDSIKKSHKKVKDTNKKSLFKPKAMKVDMEEDKNTQADHVDGNSEDERAVTPENTNSSRLLLSQFSSVKKSHRKNKHRIMVSGSLQRKKFFGHESEAAWNSDIENHNSSVSSSIDDISSMLPSENPSDFVEAPTESNLDGLSPLDNGHDVPCYSFEEHHIDKNACEAGINALPTTESPKSSPNKRKNVFDDASSTAIFQSPSKQPSTCVSSESAEEEFKIFTPIKKRKSLILLAPIARRICDNDLSLECTKLPDDPLPGSSNSRCCTPTAAARSSFQIMANTPEADERQKNGAFIPITDNLTSMPGARDQTGDGNCGRAATPQDQSTSILMADINSIKKSHKKDKRGNVTRRSWICAQDEEYEAAACGTSFENDRSPSLRSRDDERASTSQDTTNDCSGIAASNENNAQVKTPPNCSRAKNFLKLLQTESIKRSHKKVRERKKFEQAVVKCELSNDGSIFDEAERSLVMDNEDLDASHNETLNDTDGGYPTGNFTSVTECVANSYQNKGRYLRGADPCCSSGNLSDDGSIFDAAEKNCTP